MAAKIVENVSSLCALTVALFMTVNSQTAEVWSFKRPFIKPEFTLPEFTFIKPECSEFHFGDCHAKPGTNYTGYMMWRWSKDLIDCKWKCDRGWFGYLCEAFAFKEIKGHELPHAGACGHYNSNWNDGAENALIRRNCDWVSGRVDRQNEDTGALDHCVFAYETSFELGGFCRKGDCNLQHYGQPIHKDKVTDEYACKLLCRLTEKPKPCTHYKYWQASHPDYQKCWLYHANAVGSYKCDFIATQYYIKRNELDQCLKDVVPADF